VLNDCQINYIICLVNPSSSNNQTVKTMNILSRISTVLAIGSIFAVSNATFASTDYLEETTQLNRLSDTHILIAQRRERPERPERQTRRSLRQNQAFSSSIATAETALGEASAVANSRAIGGRRRSALSQSIARAISLVGNANALSSSTAESDQKAVASSLAEAETILGDALAIAQSEAISGDGKLAIATSIASAKTSLGNATAIAVSIVIQH
jgi:hypothetical protein